MDMLALQLSKQSMTLTQKKKGGGGEPTRTSYGFDKVLSDAPDGCFEKKIPHKTVL